MNAGITEALAKEILLAALKGGASVCQNPQYLAERAFHVAETFLQESLRRRQLPQSAWD